MTYLRACFKLSLFVIWTLILIPVQLAFSALQTLSGTVVVKQSPFVRLWYAGVVQILNIRIICTSTPLESDQHCLYLSNHISYLDIIVLGALLPPFFVAKADTADWPVFGFLIKLGGTLFISRKRSLVKQQMSVFKSALQRGKNLCLFPEGTTSNGCIVLPFKSSLLSVLYNDDMPDVHIVPVCLNYNGINGQVLTGNADKDAVAWYADMELVPHVWDVFKLRSIDITVTAMPPLKTTLYTDAKHLTAHCETLIRNCFTAGAPAFVDNALK